MLISPDFVLSARQFDLLWSELGFGKPPYPLRVPSVGRTRSERARLRREAFEELERSGLASRGRVDPDLASLLRILAQHDLAVDAVAQMNGPVAALAAASGRAGVLAALDSDSIALMAVTREELVHAIVDVLPAESSGPGHVVSVPVEALRRAARIYAEGAHDPDPDDDDVWGSGGGQLTGAQAYERAGLSAADARMVAELATSRVAGGQFGVSYGSGTTGKRDRAPILVTWFDTGKGRYMMVRDGAWVSIAPTDNHTIATQIDAAVTSIHTRY